MCNDNYGDHCRWRRETDVYTYTQISNNEWQQLVDIGGGRPDGGVKEPPMEQLVSVELYCTVTVLTHYISALFFILVCSLCPVHTLQ